MKSIYQMELEDKFNRKIKYREKKIETQRKIIGKQQEEIFQLKERLQQKENIRKEIREYIMTELITEWDIKNDGCVSGSDLPADAITPILEILDKENK